MQFPPSLLRVYKRYAHYKDFVMGHKIYVMKSADRTDTHSELPIRQQITAPTCDEAVEDVHLDDAGGERTDEESESSQHGANDAHWSRAVAFHGHTEEDSSTAITRKKRHYQ